MAPKRKIWLSAPILYDDFLTDTEGFVAESEEHKKIYAVLRVVQISNIKNKVERFLKHHEYFELEGFYVSSGATYYIALLTKETFDDGVFRELYDIVRLRNAPKTRYKKIDLYEEYETLMKEANSFKVNKSCKTCIYMESSHFRTDKICEAQVFAGSGYKSVQDNVPCKFYNKAPFVEERLLPFLGNTIFIWDNNNGEYLEYREWIRKIRQSCFC